MISFYEPKIPAATKTAAPRSMYTCSVRPCRPVLVLQAGQGALELLLVLVLQVDQQHVLSAGRVLVQSWAGVTQEVLIFIPESPTQETTR